MEYLRNFIDWYFGRDALVYWCTLFVDCTLLIFFYLFSYYCILGGDGIAGGFWPKLCIISLCVFPYLVFYKVFHTYTNVIKYASFIDLRNVAISNALGSIIISAIRLAFFDVNDVMFPGIRIILLTYCFSTLAMCGWRILIKFLYETSDISKDPREIFIYGVGANAVGICKTLRNQRPTKFLVRGFISPEKKYDKLYINNIPVFPEDFKLVSRMAKDHIKGIIISPELINSFRNNNQLQDQLAEAQILIYMVPDTKEWNYNENNRILQKVDIEDLLPRDEIKIDMDAIGTLLKGQKILITGAAGSIGSEMVRQIAQFNPAKLVLVDQAETPMHDIRRMMQKNFPDIESHTIVTSITNATRMEQEFATHKPDYVFHAAAYKHVPMMEDNPSEAVQNNVYGTRVIADLAVKYGTKKFVMISTDKAVNPTNVMGCSKRICEIYCQALNEEIKQPNTEIKQADGSAPVTQFVTTRFGNVLGSNGSVIPIFKEQIQNGGPVTVTHPEIIRFFMLIPEACKLVLEAGTFGQGGEIFVFDMGKPVKIADLAKRMILLSKAEGVKIKYTGLRDGEKLFEEVLSESEKTLPTKHEKIRVAQVRKYPYRQALENETRLYNASFNYDDMETVRIMKEIVPEYKSRHSKYEVLD